MKTRHAVMLNKLQEFKWVKSFHENERDPKLDTILKINQQLDLDKVYFLKEFSMLKVQRMSKLFQILWRELFWFSKNSLKNNMIHTKYVLLIIFRVSNDF